MVNRMVRCRNYGGRMLGGDGKIVQCGQVDHMQNILGGCQECAIVHCCVGTAAERSEGLDAVARLMGMAQRSEVVAVREPRHS